MPNDTHRRGPLRTRRIRVITVFLTLIIGACAVAAVIWGVRTIGTPSMVLDPVEALGMKTDPDAGKALVLNALILLLTGLFLLGGALLAASLIRHRTGRRFAQFGVLAAVTVAVAGITKDAMRLWIPPSASEGTLPGTPLDWATGLALLVVSAQVVAWPIALTGIILTLGRSWRRLAPDMHLEADEVWRPRPLTRREAGLPGLPGITGDVRESWARGFNIPEADEIIAKRKAGEPVVGVCLSGGGVRAGTLALGVMQSEQMRAKLVAADYVVSVSGGGYIAGAFQQALSDGEHPNATDWPISRDPATVFMPGTAEEDFVRRHASYLANTPGQLAQAFGRIAAHLVTTLALVFAPAVAIGIGLGLIYRGRIPQPKAGSTIWSAVVTTQPGTVVRILIAIAIPLIIAGIFALLAWWNGGPNEPQLRRRIRFRNAALCFVLLTCVTAVVTVGFPSLIGLADLITGNGKQTSGVAATTFWGVLITYIVSLASIGRTMAARMSKPPSWWRKVMSAPGGVLNMVFVILVVVLLVAAWLLVAAGVAASTIRSWKANDLTAPIGTVVAAVVLLLFALVVGGLVDETRLSLHPFYRARLASAFAVRRLARDGVDVAVAYNPDTPTLLSDYGRRSGEKASNPIFPKVIFAASATIGGSRTPAGDNRVSYTFSGDWIGGPEVGYIKAAALERVSPARIVHDLTVQGAVAISGGAISASGGGQGSPWYGTLFALSGVRLGAWLPNPGYVMQRYNSDIDAETESRMPLIPRMRRADYLLKEFVGPHTHKGPMLQVTDGGFYDNLGLVEMLRRRCSEIYAVDASGEVNGAPSTLARALSLAEQELGVTIKWDPPHGVWSASAGMASTAVMPEGMANLKPRLGLSPVLVGTIEYPAECGLPKLTGRIRVARASLWSELTPDVLTYALGHSAFPNDSTADQWFEDDDYRAYTSLGRQMGDLLAAEPSTDKVDADAEATGAEATGAHETGTQSTTGMQTTGAPTTGTGAPVASTTAAPTSAGPNPGGAVPDAPATGDPSA